jgi:subtilase family serine protease
MVAQLKPVGRLRATEKLHLTIGLPLRNQEALTALLQEIYDPNSPYYHQYLTPEQFTDQFGPTESDYATLITFVETNGLRVTGTYSDRLLLDVSGSVASIERVFHVQIYRYHYPGARRTFFSANTEPLVDLDVSILDVVGLESYSTVVQVRKIKPGIALTGNG